MFVAGGVSGCPVNQSRVDEFSAANESEPEAFVLAEKRRVEARTSSGGDYRVLYLSSSRSMPFCNFRSETGLAKNSTAPERTSSRDARVSV